MKIQELWPRFPCAVSLAFALLPLPAVAEVKVHGLFRDNAVLQRDVAIPVWGTAGDGEKITLSFNGQELSTKAVGKAAGGEWTIRLKPMPAGGPYTMTIRGENTPGANTIEIRNVLVGDVWVSSGQSNMQWPLSAATGGKEAIAASADPELRLFCMPNYVPYQATADIPPDGPGFDSYKDWFKSLSLEGPKTAIWQESSPTVVPDYSAVAYYFVRDLRKAVKVPIGLIETSLGGTLAQSWTSTETLRKLPGFSQSDYEKKFRAGIKPGSMVNAAPLAGHLFNGKISPLLRFPIRGVIWYQGESNAAIDNGPDGYHAVFSAMIRNWRKAWGIGDFPFLYVQLPPFGKIVAEPQPQSAWANLREAQRRTSLEISNTAMIVTTEWGHETDIHPPLKEPIGKGLALAARVLAYKEKIDCQGPIFSKLKIEGSKARVLFKNAGDGPGGGLQAHGEGIKDIRGFTIAGEDQKFYKADVKIEGEGVIVSSPQVTKPVAVRYGWADYPEVNLYNEAGFPASPFRTDKFPLAEPATK